MNYELRIAYNIQVLDPCTSANAPISVLLVVFLLRDSCQEKPSLLLEEYRHSKAPSEPEEECQECRKSKWRQHTRIPHVAIAPGVNLSHRLGLGVK
jgi:hypothetical protein